MDEAVSLSAGQRDRSLAAASSEGGLRKFRESDSLIGAREYIRTTWARRQPTPAVDQDVGKRDLPIP